MKRSLAILLFDEVEVLDFAGPFEVFSVAGRRQGLEAFDVFTVAERSPVTARNGLQVIPAFLLEDCPPADMLLIPGGGGFHPDGSPFGSRREMRNARLLAWIRQRAQHSEMLLSVCTGALILGAAGLLDGQRATTHCLAIEALREAAPNAIVVEGERFVDNGKIVLSEGVSAGIDMSLYVLEKLHGVSFAAETAKYMQYDYYRP